MSEWRLLMISLVVFFVDQGSSWPLNWPETRLSVQQTNIKVNVTALLLGYFVRNRFKFRYVFDIFFGFKCSYSTYLDTPPIGGLSSQLGDNAESLYMTWHHYVPYMVISRIMCSYEAWRKTTRTSANHSIHHSRSSCHVRWQPLGLRTEYLTP